MAKLNKILLGTQALLGVLSQLGADKGLDKGPVNADDSGSRLHLGLALTMYELAQSGAIDLNLLVSEIKKLQSSVSRLSPDSR